MNAQDLKNSIFQLAIQGKLVEQREEEGTAKELFEKIQAEKKRLIKEGKIKKQKSLPAIKEDEIPFDIPDTWEWVRLNQIFNFIDYRGKTPTKLTSGVVLITASNIKKGFLDFTKADFVSETEYKERQSRGITEKGDILFTTEAPLGNVAINSLDIASAGQRAITFQQYGKNNFPNELFCFFIQSPHFQFDLINNATGTTAKGIKAARLKELMLPFPPLEEQKRIVAKIEELMPYVDKYDLAYSEVEELNKKFLVDMQKSILQYAIQGKLVEQLEEDGTAEELYQKIQEEKEMLVKEGKIKKQKKLPEITGEEIPFEIPESWKWVRLGALCNYGKCNSILAKNINKDAWTLDLEDIEKDSGRVLIKKRMRDVNSSSNKHIFKQGDVLYSKLRPYLNKVVIADEDGYSTSEILPLDFGTYVFNQYAQTVLMSPYFINYTVKCSYGVKMPRLGTIDGQLAMIPLPPIEEQKRIVRKVLELLPYTNQLSKMTAHPNLQAF